jgi:predicted nuclease of predicted toxin-antitoxin system
VRILFDQGVPAPLRAHLSGHDIYTAFELGWSELTNGELLARAEQRFDVVITTDQKLRYQQNLAGRPFGVIVLRTTSWPVLQKKVQNILSAVTHVQAGQCLDV